MAPNHDRFPFLPQTARGRLLAVAAGSAVVVAGGFAALYLLVWGVSSPAPLAVSGSSTKSAGTGNSGAPTPATGPGGQVAGTWTVGSGSVAGYRVREKLAFLSAPSDAVGRTSSIKGSATLTGTDGSLVVTATSFTVDVSTLTSDKSMRDERIHSMGLQSDRYPASTFVLTSPIAVPATATSGQTARLSATGSLTIHGTTKTETIPIQVHMSGSQIEVAGSITFPWSDFGMTAPNVGTFVSVTDQATMEFDLHLQHA